MTENTYPPKPEMHPIKSSNIAKVGFTPTPGAEHGTLHVEFQNGGHYSYAEVPQIRFDELRRDKSPGSYFGRMIRGSHAATKHPPEPQKR